MKFKKEKAFKSRINELVLSVDIHNQHRIKDEILKEMHEFFDSNWCILRKTNILKTNLEIIAQIGLNADELNKLFALSTNDYVYETLISQQNSIIVTDLSLDTRNFSLYYMDLGIKSFMVSPIIFNGSTVGSIKIYSKNRENWTRKDLMILEWCASQLKNVLNMMDEFRQKNEIDYNAINTIISLLEAKDKYTKGHSRNVSNFALILAKSLKLSEIDLINIEIAALLHDIGKIIISDSILNKSGKLSDSEFSIIKEHPAIGANALRSGGYNENICRIVEQHHERWDGSGYPKGISSNDICIGARIVSVVDAYDAMISNREYSTVKSHREALIEIRRCSAKQFCPTVTAAFASIDPKILNVLDS